MKPALELLSVAIEDFLASPESEEKFMVLDWALRVNMAKWDDFSLEWFVTASNKARLPPSVEGDR